MNEYFLKEAPRPSYNPNLSDYSQRPSVNSRNPNPSIYERVLTREFLNDGSMRPTPRSSYKRTHYEIEPDEPSYTRINFSNQNNDITWLNKVSPIDYSPINGINSDYPPFLTHQTFMESMYQDHRKKEIDLSPICQNPIDSPQGKFTSMGQRNRPNEEGSLKKILKNNFEIKELQKGFHYKHDDNKQFFTNSEKQGFIGREQIDHRRVKSSRPSEEQQYLIEKNQIEPRKYSGISKIDIIKDDVNLGTLHSETIRKPQPYKYLSFSEIGELAAAKDKTRKDNMGRIQTQSPSFHINNNNLSRVSTADTTDQRSRKQGNDLEQNNLLPIQNTLKPTFTMKIDPSALTIINFNNTLKMTQNSQQNNYSNFYHLNGAGHINNNSSKQQHNSMGLAAPSIIMKESRRKSQIDKKLPSKSEPKILNISKLAHQSKVPNKSFISGININQNTTVPPNLTINQSQNQRSREMYNFHEIDEVNLENERVGLHQSKSVPRFSTSRRIFDPSPSPIGNRTSETGRISLFDEATPQRSTAGERSRPSSEEKYPSRKPILQTIQDFSQNIMQSTKNFMSRLITNNKDRSKCKCANYINTDRETCPRAQNWLFTKYNLSDLEYLQRTYEKILNSGADSKNLKQIKLDLLRTYPECKVFAPNSEGIRITSLERILQAYSNYDPQIGYVQGMNFIVGSILYHAEEYIAFWILVLMFEKCEMRDTYLQSKQSFLSRKLDLPGLAKHAQIIDFLILNNLPQLYSHFCQNSIVVEMFCTEWVCGLFGSVIPIDKMGIFLDSFIEYGWPFFYKFILVLLKSFEKALCATQDMSEIMLIFKNTINRSHLAESKINWENLMKLALQLEIDDSFIHNLHSNFDQASKRFVLNTHNQLQRNSLIS